MKTYKVFLTRSREASSLLADALWEQYKQNEGCSSGFGCADNDDRIPVLYHNCGYFTRWSSMRVKDQSMS